VKTYLDKTFPFLALTLCSHLSAAANSQYADLVLTNGEVYTMEASNPWASHIALNNGTIVAVENSSEAIEKFIGPDTRAIDLKSKFVLPGFIDAHTHFNAAGRQIIDVNLLKVSNDQGLLNEIKRVSSNIAQGEWITGGLWGAYEQWADGSDKAKTAKGKRWKPTRSMIDPTTQKHPCFLWSFDRALYLANTLALKTANLENAKAAFEEHLRGSLKVGKLADITVCDRNLLKIPSSQILDMKIEMTIVDGKIVYERN